MDNVKILVVDDEPNVLHSIKRQLRKKFSLDTATSGPEALKMLKESGPYAVIIADMRMPGMNGIELLAKVKEEFPDTVRMMLTGNADQETAIRAVNEGNIFRFMNKPCPVELLEKNIEAALEQYRLIIAERQLLEQTLSGSIKVLAEILSQVNPAAFSRAFRIRNLVDQLVKAEGLPNAWEFSIAALLSQLGCVSLPSDLVEKVYAGASLSKEEEEMFKNHPLVGAQLLKNIPRLERVAAMIALQLKGTSRKTIFRFDACVKSPIFPSAK